MKARHVLGSLAFWVALAYLGLAALTAYGWTINARTLQEEADRRARATAAVEQCLRSRPVIENFNQHVEGVNQLALVLVENSARALKVTPKGDGQYEVRKANLIRLIRAREHVKALRSFPVPTGRSCRMLG